MRPITVITRLLGRLPKKRPEQEPEEEIQQDIVDFINEVDTRVRVFGLDPNLPEITALKAQARDLVTAWTGGPKGGLARLALSQLNPYHQVELHGTKVIIPEAFFGRAIMPWTLVEFHIGQHARLSRVCKRIRVDGTGTTIFDEQGTEYARYMGGVLNPHRFADPGNRVENAVLFVNHFTGLSITRDELWPMYWAEFTLGDDGLWHVELGSEQPINA